MADQYYLRIARYVASSTLAGAIGAVVLAWIGIPLIGIPLEWRHLALVLGIVAMLVPILSLPRALTKERLRETKAELERLAHIDPLSGLLNRRAFFEHANEIFALPVSAAAPIGLLMIDADDFKSINDKHGHAGGDAVIRSIAATIVDTVGEATGYAGMAGARLIARIGGEEFVVLVEGFDEKSLTRLADDIRIDIQKFIRGDDGNPAVTVSIGVTIRQQGQDPDAALRVADAALYDAKRGGRNRVCFSAAAQAGQPSATLVPELSGAAIRSRKRAVEAA